MSNSSNPIFQSGLDNSQNVRVQAYVFAVFAGITSYNAIELLVLCFTTFKRYQGCYFWSLLVATSSLIPYCLGYILFMFPLGIPPYASVALIVVFWCGMVTGQSLVLWSRLHLVVQHPKVLRGVLGIIVANACLLHVPSIVLFYGAVSPYSRRFMPAYGVMERIQLVVFCLQELLISSIYIWETVKMLRWRPERHTYGILVHLLIANIVILVLDLAVVGIEYARHYAIEVMFKPVAYSIKLKLEYAILGQFIEIAHGDLSDQSSIRGSHPPSFAGTPSESREGSVPQARDQSPSSPCAVFFSSTFDLILHNARIPFHKK